MQLTLPKLRRKTHDPRRETRPVSSPGGVRADVGGVLGNSKRVVALALPKRPLQTPLEHPRARRRQPLLARGAGSSPRTPRLPAVAARSKV